MQEKMLKSSLSMHFFEAHGLHRVAVATRELALDKGAEEGQAKADVRRYKKNDIRNTHAIFLHI